MSATEFLERLSSRGIVLRVLDGRIQAMPISEIGADDREQVCRFKSELMALLTRIDDGRAGMESKLTPAIELYEERAGIRQFDAKLSRKDAEILAQHDINENDRRQENGLQHRSLVRSIGSFHNDGS